MGFNDQEIVALSGAHSLGRCHAGRSGFEGPWSVTPTKFSTQYYKVGSLSFTLQVCYRLTPFISIRCSPSLNG